MRCIKSAVVRDRARHNALTAALADVKRGQTEKSGTSFKKNELGRKTKNPSARTLMGHEIVIKPLASGDGT
jgi:hypothetical protein